MIFEMKFSVLFAAFSHNVDPASFLHLGLEFVKSKQKTRKLLSPPPFLVKNTYSVGWADFLHCIVLYRPMGNFRIWQGLLPLQFASIIACIYCILNSTILYISGTRSARKNVPVPICHFNTYTFKYTLDVIFCSFAPVFIVNVKNIMWNFSLYFYLKKFSWLDLGVCCMYRVDSLGSYVYQLRCVP